MWGLGSCSLPGSPLAHARESVAVVVCQDLREQPGHLCDSQGAGSPAEPLAGGAFQNKLLDALVHAAGLHMSCIHPPCVRYSLAQATHRETLSPRQALPALTVGHTTSLLPLPCCLV